jgi:hypothetical protein
MSLIAGECFAQRGPGMHINSMPPLGNPLPALSPIPPAGGSPRPPMVPSRGPRPANFYPLPYSPVAYDPQSYYPPAVPPPSVTIIQQFAAPVAAAIPENPVTPHIQEYSAPAGAAAPLAEPVLFSIVLKDGSVLPAAVAIVQGNTLQIVDADGRQRRVPESAIDRDATRRRNAEHNLRLQLPPAP